MPLKHNCAHVHHVEVQTYIDREVPSINSYYMHMHKVASFPGLSLRLLSLTVSKAPAFHTVSAFHTVNDKSLGDKPGNERGYAQSVCESHQM